MIRRASSLPLLLLALPLAPATAWCQDDAPIPPHYASRENVRGLRGTGDFRSPEDHARPGEVFFLRAASAVVAKDYPFAVDMYKVAASWAYKPAEYNLAVMYFRGEGVPVDRPLAMAWIALAAERGDQDYIDARELIYSQLSAAEFAQANEIWRDLKKSYGDEVALKRAKARWLEVRNNVTGSHVGSIGHLLVGNGDNSGHLGNLSPDMSSTASPFSDTPFGMTGSSTVDGSIAYRQLHASDNPYDPKFEVRPGTATVEPIIPLHDLDTGDQDDSRPHNI